MLLGLNWVNYRSPHYNHSKVNSMGGSGVMRTVPL